MALATLLCLQGHSQDEYLVSSELLSTTPAFLLSVPPFITGEYDVDYYKITYNTVDVAGNPTVASGAVGVPVGAACDIFPMTMYCHGTVLRKQDIPSAENSESQIIKVFSAVGYITVAPDYLGLGVNPGLHPYVHAESQATASIDAYFAAAELIESLEEVTHNGELLVTGYSQGGHASMATLKYAQENGLLEEMGIIGGAPLSGPYNMSGSQAEVLLSDEPYSNPGYVVYLLKSYQLAYGNIYNELSDILQSPYDELVLPYFDGEQNEYDMAVVNEQLPMQLSELLVDTVLANMASNDDHPIWQALRDNDNYDWAPQMPLRMFYCDGDEQVPFTNSTVALETMQANGAADVDAANVFPGANHGGCIIPAILATRTFFDQLVSPCGLISSTADAEKMGSLKMWPNPANDQVRFAFSEPVGVLSVYDMYGKLILMKNVNGTELTVPVSHLAAGTYVAIFEGLHNVERATLMVQ